MERGEGRILTFNVWWGRLNLQTGNQSLNTACVNANENDSVDRRIDGAKEEEKLLQQS